MGSAVDGDGDAPYASRQGGPMDLRLEAVSHRFDALAVLDHIDLTARDGEILALIGPSGCGKSTLLQIAGGMIRPTAGRSEERRVGKECVSRVSVGWAPHK